jgi:hypothetical protein
MILDASAPLAKVLIEDGRFTSGPCCASPSQRPGFFFAPHRRQVLAKLRAFIYTGAHHTTEQLRSCKPVADDNWIDS